MFKRLAGLLLLAWLLGFVWFAAWLPNPVAGGKSDGVVVLTGGGGRIGRGLEALGKGWANRMLVSGVDRHVKPREFAVQYKVPAKTMACCVTLGFDSVDTRSNARETARWVARNKFKSLRLVTTDWHMRRAAFELDRVNPPGVRVIRDAVPSDPSFETLFREYHKLLARWLAQAWGG